MESPATAAQRALRTLTTPLTGSGRRAAIKRRLSRLPAGGYARPAGKPRAGSSDDVSDEKIDDDLPPATSTPVAERG